MSEFRDSQAGRFLASAQKYMQKGPNGIQVLCFAGGVATFLCGLGGIFSIIAALLSPFQYLMSIYQALFGLVTVILEVEFEWSFMEKVREPTVEKIVDNFQEMVNRNMHVLTYLWGRGVFYIFMGSLAVVMGGIVEFIVGLYMIIVGVLCISLHVGYRPNLTRAQTQFEIGFQRISDITSPFLPKQEENPLEKKAVTIV